MSLLLLTKSFVKHKKYSNRGVADVIAAMLLLSITLVGGVLVFVIVQNSDQLTFVTSEQESLNPNVIPKLILSGYDTRDTDNLYDIPLLNNQIGTDDANPDHLCTSCSPNEFILLKVRNDSNVLVEITTISINEVEHVFDTEAVSGQLFVSSGVSATVPENGEFIIISGSGISGLKQELLPFLPEGSEKRLLIRLSTSITPDIPLNSKIRVIINSSVESTQLLLVPAGRLA